MDGKPGNISCEVTGRASTVLLLVIFGKETLLPQVQSKNSRVL